MFYCVRHDWDELLEVVHGFVNIDYMGPITFLNSNTSRCLLSGRNRSYMRPLIWMLVKSEFFGRRADRCWKKAVDFRSEQT
jgi:hypothetical protein